MMSCNCHGRCVWSKIGWILVLVGAVNWGLVGLGMLLGNAGGWNVVAMIFGSGTLAAIVYLLVGISAVVSIVGCPCKKCKDAKANCVSCKVEASKPVSSNPAM